MVPDTLRWWRHRGARNRLRRASSSTTRPVDMRRDAQYVREVVSLLLYSIVFDGERKCSKSASRLSDLFVVQLCS